ncbi:MAG: hypothetical protein J4G01_03090 [Dehalococcoidia bacterium]|nr:hypothetical protein [Dehalococcoidia bacterium]
MIAVLASMKREISAVAKLRCVENYPGGVRFVTTGVGREKVEASLAAMDEWEDKPSGIISLGYAAALQEGLEPGDLVISDSVTATGEEFCFESDPDLLAQVRSVTEGVQPGRSRIASSVTLHGVATSRAEKRLIAAMTSASIANMEDYWVARWAFERGIPYVSVRSVLDTLSQEVPEFISKLAGMKLPVQVMGVAIQGIVRPEKLESLVRLFKEDRIARRSLKEFGASFLSGGLSAHSYAAT